MKHKNYQSYTKEEFLEDAFFTEWVRSAQPDAAAFWEAWEAEGHANAAVMREARTVLEGIFSLERIKSPAAAKAAVWAGIQAGMEKQPDSVSTPLYRRFWYAAAAVILPVAIFGGYYLFSNREKRYSTGNGEHLVVTLPDSSTVTMNANTTITYRRWSQEKREVWLSGEAVFEVKPSVKTLAAPFTVHAGEVDVDVLGTVFNIKNRRNKAEIFLQSGKVRVTGLQKHNSVVLMPDQKANYSSDTLQVVTSSAGNTKPMAWREYKMELTNTSVKDIIETLQDQYGYTIVLQDSSIANTPIEGTLRLQNINSVLFELSNILNVTIEKHNDTLTFKNNGPRGY
ncbi:FecR family protein [Chitinophaga jiangningensis]|uniref:FecR family protein n=1 Tax=Chitinophaga jiangningensis TaxID=1419482 RepID=A0A1M6WLV0_9BACT|nr:FecR domain-containing protein [Chitinophaga jiangningensis]SHK94586.1 FecR family protein [Chitinophaga jiangningensis]